MEGRFEWEQKIFIYSLTKQIIKFRLDLTLSKGLPLPFEANRVKPGVTPIAGLFYHIIIKIN